MYIYVGREQGCEVLKRNKHIRMLFLILQILYVYTCMHGEHFALYFFNTVIASTFVYMKIHVSYILA